MASISKPLRPDDFDRGRVAPYRGEERAGERSDRLNLSAPAGTAPYVAAETMFRACGEDGLFGVADVR